MKLEFDRTENVVNAEDAKQYTWYIGRHKKTNKKGLILKINDDLFYRITDGFINPRTFHEVEMMYDLFELSSDAITIKIDKNKIL